MGELEQRQQMGIIPRKKEEQTVLPSDLPISRMHREVYLSSRNFPKVREIDDKNVVVNGIHVLINQTILDKGVNMPVEEIDYLKTRVTDDIIQDFGGYSLEEIRLSFHYGVRGEFGEYFGLNPITFYGWLRSFRYNLLPTVNQQIQKLLPKPKPVIPSQEETDAMIQETLYGVYFNLCTNGVYEFYDVGNICYKYLDRLGLIPYSNEQKMEFINESRNSFSKSVKRRDWELRQQGKEFHRIDVDRAFEQLEEKSNPTFEHQVRVGAMRLALYHFLKDCAEQDLDLKEIIDNNQTEKQD